MLKEKPGPKCDVKFTASSGQFKQFKKSYSLHNVKPSVDSVSADMKAAEEFLEMPDKLIVEENYLHEQIFNMDETSLFNMDETSLSGNRCLKGLSLIRSPSQDQAFKYKIKILLRGYKATN